MKPLPYRLELGVRFGRAGAWTALATVVAMGVLVVVISMQGAEPQPSAPTMAYTDVLAQLARIHVLRTLFLCVDVVFIFAYLAVFSGLFCMTLLRWPLISITAFLFGLCAGGADLFENAQLLWYQFADFSLSHAGWIRLMNTYCVKWTASGAALICFALAWPWDGRVSLPVGGEDMILIHRRLTVWTGISMCVFAVAALAAGFYAGYWMRFASFLFLPNLVLTVVVFRRALS